MLCDYKYILHLQIRTQGLTQGAPSLKVSESNSQNVRWQDPESKRAEDHNG